MAYGYAGTMKTTPGNRRSVIEILLEGTDGLRALGCSLYIVSEAPEADTIHVFEVWESGEHHRASLEDPGVREAIARAMPILDMASFANQELAVIGGLGILTHVPPSS